MSTVNNKPATEWTPEQLVAWARGELTAGGSASDRTVAAEAVKRLGLEASEDVSVVKGQILAEQPEQPSEEAAETGEENATEEAAPAAAPEPTPVAKPASTVGVTGAGAVPATPKPEVKPAATKPVAPTPKVTGANQTLTNKPAAAPAAAKPTEPEKKSLNRQVIEQNLANYIAVMKPGQIHNAEDGAAAQVSLFRTIQNVLRQEGGEFTTAFTLLLNFVNTNRKGAFNERFAFRYMDQVRLSAPERKNFERFMNLLLTTCDPATRHQTIKQVDLTATMAGWSDTNVQQRVQAFYSL